MSVYDEAKQEWKQSQNGRGGGSDDASDGAPAEFSYIWWSDLKDMPDPQHRFVVRGLLPLGGSSLLVAKPKEGKTTMAHQIARCVAEGKPFLECEVLQGTVLYHAFEEKVPEVKRVQTLAGLCDGAPVGYYFGEPPANRLGALRQAIEQFKPTLVVLDTLAYFMKLTDYNDYAQVNNGLRAVHAIARLTGVHILCVHHSPKGADRDTIDAGLGSVGFSGGVDTVIRLRRNESNGRIVETEQRYGDSWPATLLAFDRETCTLSVEGVVTEMKREATETDILAMIAGRARTQSDIQEALKMRRATLLAALGRLVKDGKVLRTGQGNSASPYMYEAVETPTDESETYTF